MVQISTWLDHGRGGRKSRLPTSGPRFMTPEKNLWDYLAAVINLTVVVAILALATFLGHWLPSQFDDRGGRTKERPAVSRNRGEALSNWDYRNSGKAFEPAILDAYRR